MIQDTIQEIRDAEKRADEMLAAAQEEAAALRGKADTDAEEQKKAARIKVKAYRDAKLAAAKAAADAATAKTMETASSEGRLIIESSRTKKAKAVDFIVSKIVG